MKLTKQKLKRIIKEELEEAEVHSWGPLSWETPDATIVDTLSPIFEAIEKAYGSLGHLEEQEEFEDILTNQINEYVEAWQRQREKSS
tara:strand:+ start:50 stop:310 length:261 start_codon:yes stop_codon:yes gene_type:complete